MSNFLFYIMTTLSINKKFNFLVICYFFNFLIFLMKKFFHFFPKVLKNYIFLVSKLYIYYISILQNFHFSQKTCKKLLQFFSKNKCQKFPFLKKSKTLEGFVYIKELKNQRQITILSYKWKLKMKYSRRQFQISHQMHNFLVMFVFFIIFILFNFNLIYLYNYL